MRIMRLCPLFAVSLLSFATAIQAQQAPTSTPAPRDAQAVLVLQRSLAALTGTVQVNDVTLTGTVTRTAGSDNESGTVTLKATAVGQGRIDLSLSSGQRSEVVDISQVPPTGGWRGTDGVWHSMAAHNLFSDPTWFFPTFLLSRALSEANYSISPMDAETRDDVAVEHVTIYQQPGFVSQQSTPIQGLSQIDIYLDASTLLPASIAFSAHADTNALVDIPVEIKFLNYQVVQGVSIPYHIQKYVQNGLVLDLTLSSAQINSGLSGVEFQVQ